MDNMTSDDALTAGKTLLKGGSKEDAAIAVVKGRAEDKVESMTGADVDLDDLSKDGMIEAGKDVAMEKAKGSASKYTNGVPSVGGVSTDGVLDAGKAMAEEKVKSSATSYGDKAAGSAKKYSDPAAAGSSTTYSEPKAAGSSTTYSEPAAAGSSTTYSEPATTTAPLNCPSGTKDAGDGTCMITGNWGN